MTMLVNTSTELLVDFETTEESSRYSNVDAQKLAGATYTPAAFATFVARQILAICSLPSEGAIRILDPAVGDGALLVAILDCLPISTRLRAEVYGYDTDKKAVDTASKRLKTAFPEVSIRIELKDFLEHVLSLKNNRDLFANEEQEKFHLVIANPPYVRTQILGAERTKEIAQCFGLTGRVDLYYPFLLGISEVLAVGGITGVITSNRFMTTKSGQAVRRAMLSRFHIIHAWDLGDTKLFDAAVLPCVLLAKGSLFHHHPTAEGIALSTMYETQEQATVKANDAFHALDFKDDTVVAIDTGRRFRVRHGALDNGNDPEGLWRISTDATSSWLSKVESKTWDTFKRIGKIRVGVKSTADKVFIRHDWSDLPDGRPELLKPLITRYCARRFRASIPEKAKHVKEILYPHYVFNGRRSAIDISQFPKAEKYLERHRDVLEARTYVIEAGRKWYELWVPQDPAAWSSPKLVFPDISEKPIFWIDTDGGVVNGECYWLCCENENESDLLWLALAVANSTFIEEFYDHKFNNKLYAGRRRFITQYVEQFPLPDPESEKSKSIISMVKKIHSLTPSKEADMMASQLNELVSDIFLS